MLKVFEDFLTVRDNTLMAFISETSIPDYENVFKEALVEVS
jgi:hypothetical protein